MGLKRLNELEYILPPVLDERTVRAINEDVGSFLKAVQNAGGGFCMKGEPKMRDDEQNDFSIQSHSSGLWRDENGVLHAVEFDDERESEGFELLPPVRDFSADSAPIPVQLDDSAGGVSSPEGSRNG